MLFFKDLKITLKKTDLWLFFGWFDIVLRYKRTTLGPFWLVITNSVTLVATSIIGSFIFKTPLSELFPYVAIGTVIWSFITSILTDSCNVFVTQAGIIKNMNVPLMSFCLRLFIRNAIVLAHNIIIVFVVLVFCQVKVGLLLFFLPISFLFFALNAFALAVNIGFLNARFRDIQQVIQASLGILAFMTPVVWPKSLLGDHQIVANINPFTHFIDLFRIPLLGGEFEMITLTYVSVLTLFNIALAAKIYGLYKHKLVFWI